MKMKKMWRREGGLCGGEEADLGVVHEPKELREIESEDAVGGVDAEEEAEEDDEEEPVGCDNQGGTAHRRCAVENT